MGYNDFPILLEAFSFWNYCFFSTEFIMNVYRQFENNRGLLRIFGPRRANRYRNWIWKKADSSWNYQEESVDVFFKHGMRYFEHLLETKRRPSVLSGLPFCRLLVPRSASAVVDSSSQPRGQKARSRIRNSCGLRERVPVAVTTNLERFLAFHGYLCSEATVFYILSQVQLYWRW